MASLFSDKAQKAFIDATRGGDLILAETILGRLDLDINFVPRIGMNALMWAANNGNLPMVQWLLSKGANVNLLSQSVRENGFTALMFAAQCPAESAPRIIHELVRAGADLNYAVDLAPGIQGHTALTVAARSVNEANVRAILEHQPHIDCEHLYEQLYNFGAPLSRDGIYLLKNILRDLEPINTAEHQDILFEALDSFPRELSDLVAEYAGNPYKNTFDHEDEIHYRYLQRTLD